MRQLSKENLIVRIFDDRTQMGDAAGKAAAEAINAVLRSKSEANVIFAAAPSQNEILASLAKQHVEWNRVNAFHMDEYVGLAPDAPQTFRSYLKENIFGYVSPRTIHFIEGNSQVDEECARYTKLLQKFPPDVVCMGIGENGHIAFNDPPADFDDPQRVKVVTLDEWCRQQQVNDGCFPSLDKVPRQAITLTIPALLQAQYIICVVPGPRKAKAVHNTLTQDIDPMFPSTVLRRHLNATLYLDADSARQV